MAIDFLPKTGPDPTVRRGEPPRGLPSGLANDVVELVRVAVRDRWGAGLALVGWWHLAVFLICQRLHRLGDRTESHFVSLWALDLTIGVFILRRFLRRPDGGSAPSLLVVIARIWATFLILAFSSAALNSLVGFQTDWFKAVWATLSTFGFATMAWILHLKFLIPAVQMSLTALLIARYPAYAYGIFGLSWCVALNSVGLVLERRRWISTGVWSRGPDPVRSKSVVRSVEAGGFGSD